MDLAKDPRFEYVMVFKNHGEPAGASLEHPHSQLIATPMVPIMVEEELAGALQHFRIKKRCIWCDVVRQERRERRPGRSWTPDGFMAPWPPSRRGSPSRPGSCPPCTGSRFEEIAADELAAARRGCSATCCGRMNRVLGDPPFNFMLHTRPLKAPALDHFHWHLEIIPKLTRVAGFEWGTGFFINPTPPEEAAKYSARRGPGGARTLTPCEAFVTLIRAVL